MHKKNPILHKSITLVPFITTPYEETLQGILCHHKWSGHLSDERYLCDGSVRQHRWSGLFTLSWQIMGID